MESRQIRESRKGKERKAVFPVLVFYLSFLGTSLLVIGIHSPYYRDPCNSGGVIQKWVLAKGASRGTSAEFEYPNVNPTNSMNKNENAINRKEKINI